MSTPDEQGEADATQVGSFQLIAYDDTGRVVFNHTWVNTTEAAVRAFASEKGDTDDWSSTIIRPVRKR